MAKAYALFGGTEQITEPVGDPVDRNGTPVRTFRKDIARVGRYRHPKEGWELDVTPDRLDAWVAAFDAMRANGVDVEVVVDHSFDADAIRGYVTKMWRDGDTLYSEHEMHGARAIELAETARNTSPWIDRRYTDGKNNHYGEAIVHSAICQQPVIPGQEGFTALAASLRHDGANALILSMETDDMALNIEEFRAMLGADATLTEETLVAAIGARLQAAETEKAEATGKVDGLTAEVETLTAKLTEAKAGQPAAPDADILDQLADATNAGIDALMDSGKLAPAMAASLKTLVVGPEDARNAYALSKTYSGRPRRSRASCSTGSVRSSHRRIKARSPGASRPSHSATH